MQKVCRSLEESSTLAQRSDSSAASRSRRARLCALVVLVTLIAFTFVAAPSVRAGAATPRIPVILDTDMYNAADDLGAETMLFAGALFGQDNVIAIGADVPYYRPAVATDTWKCLAAVAQFYGYPNTPIGSDMPDNGPAPTTKDYLTPCAAFASPTTPAPLPVVSLYRKALVSQPNGSVVIVATGYEENIDALLNSPPDSISPLTGAQLIAQKVSVLVATGGGYPSLNGENNFEGHAGAAEDVAANWPTKIVYSGYEVGSQVFTGQTVTSRHPANSPVRAAMAAYAGNNHAITSFDLTTAYHALQPGDASLTEVGPGTNSITTTGSNTFTLGTGDEYYLQLTNTTGLEKSIESYWDTLPGTVPQTVTFSSPPSTPTVGGTYAASASGGATGNPVTLTIDPSSTSGCTIDGSNVVHFSTPLGTCIIDANEPGDTTYAPASTQQTLQVAGIPQAISFTSTPPTNPTVGDTYNVSATGGASSNPVTFTIDGTSTSGCAVDGSGKVTLSAPRGTCIIDANQLGTSSYAAAAQVQQTISVGGIAQTVSFSTTPPSTARVGGPAYTPSATASSGLGVSFTLDPLSKGCSLSGAAIKFTAVGTCVVDATQVGSPTYVPAKAQQSFAIGRGVSVITARSRAPGLARAGGSYTPTAQSNTHDPIRVSLGAHSTGCAVVHGTVEFRSVGTCVVAFIDPGNANYHPSTLAQSIKVSKGHVRLEMSTPGTARAGAVVSMTGSVSVAFATGTVTFSSQGKILCAVALRGGLAECRSPISLPKGSYRIVASYSGSGSFFATKATTIVRLT